MVTGRPTDDGRPERILFAGLFLLTVVTGMVDAASFLGLGHVFTANMTGNVLLLGFSVAGSKATEAAGLSASLTAAALGGFVTGAASGSLLCGPRQGAPRLLGALGAEAVALGASAVLASSLGPGGSGARYGAVVLAAWAMGVQNAAIRRLGRPDVNTTVLTTALGGVVADAVEVGGRPVRAGRRLATVALLFAGAAIGAAFEQIAVGWALVAALVVFALGAVALVLSRAPAPGQPT